MFQTKYPELTDEQLVERLTRAYARREAVRPNEDAIRALVLEEITPLEFDLVIRGIPAYTVPQPTASQIEAARIWGK